MFERLFGGQRDEETENREGKVTVRIEFAGKTFVQRYDDLEMAQLRLPQYLADLQSIHGRELHDRDER